MPDEIVPVVLDSSNKSSGTNENFTINLLRPINHVKRIVITDINLPLSYYNINANNNVLYFEQPVSTGYNVTIAIGNYTGATLAAAIATAMNLVSGGFTVTFDTDTFKFTFTHVGGFTLLKPTTQPLSTLWPYLGFDNEYITTIQTSDNVVNLSSPRYIKIKSIILGSPHQRIHKTQFGATEDNTILTLFPDSIFGCILVKSDIDETITYTHSFQITSIDLFLTDENDQALDLNGNDWVLALNFIVR